MEKFAQDIFRLQDPERLLVIALLLSPHVDEKGKFRERPLHILERIFSPNRPQNSNRATRLIRLLRGAGYLENMNPGSNSGTWILHLPSGVQSLAGHELAVRAELIADTTKLVQRWGKEKIPDIIAALQDLQSKKD